MKKKLFAFFSAVFLSAVCILGVAACGGNSNNNKKPPKPSGGMLSPRIISFGDFISWDVVENADEYEIYCDGELKSVVKEPLYRVGDLSKDSNFCVVAKNTVKGEKTDKSNLVKVSKNGNYASGEILNLTDRSGFVSQVSPSVRKMVIGGQSRTSFEIGAVLAKRTTDIVLELNNIDLTGFITTDDYSYKRADNDYNVIFKLKGNCSFKGENGSDGFDYSDSVYDNMEIDAGEGFNGGTALIVPSLVVCGSGELSVSGGNGGNGGVGSATTKWEATNGPGAGADGGDGGAAVKCSYVAVDFESDSFFVSFTDGKGGKKGVPGENGSIITGPMASAMWKDMYDIGKAGKNGKSVIGTKKIIKGRVVL